MMIQKILFLLGLGWLLIGCHSLSFKRCSKCSFKKQAISGYSHVQSVSDDSVKGWARFDSTDKYKVKIKAEVEGLQPNKNLGFHIHEFGNCENKALSAGGHLNPKKKPHGGPSDKERHLGDLGNLKTDNSGKAVYENVVRGKVYKLLGRSIVIHSKEDDLKTQPSGDSGSRIACGIIGAIPLFTSP